MRKRRLCYKCIWCSGGLVPRIFDQGITWDRRRVPNEFSSVKSFAVSGIWRNVRSGTGLSAAEKRTHPAFPGSESRPLRLYRRIFSLLTEMFTAVLYEPCTLELLMSVKIFVEIFWKCIRNKSWMKASFFEAARKFRLHAVASILIFLRGPCP